MSSANQFSQALRLGIATGLLGGVLALTGWGASWEETISLDWLFKLRGPMAPPPEVVIVSIDKSSATQLGVSAKPSQWPRTRHAELIHRLVNQGAAVIVFDVFFEEARSTQEDAALAAAIGNAGRVVLFQQSVHQKLDGMALNKLVDPISALSDSASGLAPFPLPKVPNRVSHFWSFFSSLGDTPTLPVAALQLYALKLFAYDDLVTLLERTGLQGLDRLPRQVRSAEELRGLMSALRGEFRRDAQLVRRFEKVLASGKQPALPLQVRSLLLALANTYSGDASYWLNFYGPATTVTTIPYSAFWRSDTPVDVANKVVFVGHVDTSSADQIDNYYTVFSSADGIDLNGTEIIATAFANLLTERPLRSPDILVNFGVILAFGGLIGVLAYCLSGVFAVLATLAAAIGYFGAAHYAFVTHDLWLPLFVPLLMQLPLALLSGLFCQYRGARQARDKVNRAIRYYVPEAVAEDLVASGAPSTTPQTVYGTCLCTDVENYTTLSERLEPQALAELKNEYFGLLGEEVAQHKGVLMDIAGDGMVCLWAAPQPNREMRLQACLAALGMLQAVRLFNASHADYPFPTRLGLHAGWVAMGNLGGGGRLLYSVMGDIVNTASRIEGLNKLLGTSLLAAEAVVSDLDELLIRRIGSFQLKGKTQALSIVQIMGRQPGGCATEHALCERFAAALSAFEAGCWRDAAGLFAAILAVYPLDGPSRFYLQRCHQYCTAPPAPAGEPVIRLEVK